MCSPEIASGRIVMINVEVSWLCTISTGNMRNQASFLDQRILLVFGIVPKWVFACLRSSRHLRGISLDQRFISGQPIYAPEPR